MRKILSVLMIFSIFTGVFLSRPMSLFKVQGGTNPEYGVWQDFNEFTDTENLTSSGAASISNFANSNAVFELDNTDSFDGTGAALKYNSSSGTSLNSDYNTRVNLSTNSTVPAGATGISFYIKRLGSNNTANILIFPLGMTHNTNPAPPVAGSPVRYHFTLNQTQNQWVKVTVRFDQFLHYNNTYGVTSETQVFNNSFVPRHFWDSVDGFQIRVRHPDHNVNRSFSIDNLSWHFDNLIEDFETAQIGDGAEDIQVSYSSLDNFTVAPEAAEIVDGASNGTSDSGKSLKIDLGETTANQGDGAGATIPATAPYIRIVIPTAGKSLLTNEKPSLRIWMRNESGETAFTRMQIIRPSDGDPEVSNAWISREGRSAAATTAPADTRTEVRGYRSTYSYANFAHTTSLSRIRHSSQNINALGQIDISSNAKLAEATAIEIFIFPREGNNGGILYIDGITVLGAAATEMNPLEDFSIVAGFPKQLPNPLIPAVPGPIFWEVSDETVANITNGVITALKTGTVTLTARSNGIDPPASCTVTVYGKPDLICELEAKLLKLPQMNFDVTELYARQVTVIDLLDLMAE